VPVMSRDGRYAGTPGGGVPASGYEIHCGVTSGPDLARPLVELEGRTDGAHSKDGQVIGTYLHGIFEEATACTALLRWAGLTRAKTPDYRALREAEIERLADAAEAHLDIDAIRGMMNCST